MLTFEPHMKSSHNYCCRNCSCMTFLHSYSMLVFLPPPLSLGLSFTLLWNIWPTLQCAGLALELATRVEVIFPQSALALSQRTMEMILAGIEDVCVYVYPVKSLQEHHFSLRQVLGNASAYEHHCAEQTVCSPLMCFMLMDIVYRALWRMNMINWIQIDEVSCLTSPLPRTRSWHISLTSCLRPCPERTVGPNAR